jgi:hypothetical protein
MSEAVNFQQLKKTMAPVKVVKPGSSGAEGKIYSVTSEDAGDPEAQCLIADKGSYVSGCGYNQRYNVIVGQGKCTVENFDERSTSIPTLRSSNLIRL